MDNVIKESMERVFHNNSWHGAESKSGRGSDPINTKNIEYELPLLLNSLGIKTILDIPCGDFAWMPRLLSNLPSDIKYHGADIVQDIINDNQKYATDNVSFSCLDITEDQLPKADIAIIRDCFNHLPYESIYRGLNNLKNSDIEYVALTHFNWKRIPNKDIAIGKEVNWRRLNYTMEPFSFANPMDLIVEGSSESGGNDKTLAIWKVSDIKL
jgi:hypothetical protein